MFSQTFSIRVEKLSSHLNDWAGTSDPTDLAISCSAERKAVCAYVCVPLFVCVRGSVLITRVVGWLVGEAGNLSVVSSSATTGLLGPRPLLGPARRRRRPLCDLSCTAYFALLLLSCFPVSVTFQFLEHFPVFLVSLDEYFHFPISVWWML